MNRAMLDLRDDLFRCGGNAFARGMVPVARRAETQPLRWLPGVAGTRGPWRRFLSRPLLGWAIPLARAMFAAGCRGRMGNGVRRRPDLEERDRQPHLAGRRRPRREPARACGAAIPPGADLSRGLGNGGLRGLAAPEL